MHCGAQFTHFRYGKSGPPQKYCTEDCGARFRAKRWHAKRQKLPKPPARRSGQCLGCKARLPDQIGSGRTRRFCSRACNNKHRWDTNADARRAQLIRGSEKRAAETPEQYSRRTAYHRQYYYDRCQESPQPILIAAQSAVAQLFAKKGGLQKARLEHDAKLAPLPTLPTQEAVCVSCEITFQVLHPGLRQKYCTATCRTDFYNARRHAKSTARGKVIRPLLPCKQCGTAQPDQINARGKPRTFCSLKCGKTYRSEKGDQQ